MLFLRRRAGRTKRRVKSIKRKSRASDFSFLAGTAGFEPADNGVKVRCLTTWRRPCVPATPVLYHVCAPLSSLFCRKRRRFRRKKSVSPPFSAFSGVFRAFSQKFFAFFTVTSHLSCTILLSQNAPRCLRDCPAPPARPLPPVRFISAESAPLSLYIERFPGGGGRRRLCRVYVTLMLQIEKTSCKKDEGIVR